MLCPEHVNSYVLRLGMVLGSLGEPMDAVFTERAPPRSMLAMRPVSSPANEEAVHNAIQIIAQDAGCSIEAVVRRVYQA